MDFIINDFTLTRIGLVFNLLGTIMISFSFGKHIGGGYNKKIKGNRFIYPFFTSYTVPMGIDYTWFWFRSTIH
jgi:hypothetical protein